MASIRNVSGRWQVQIRRTGIKTSRTFGSRREAETWAQQVEAPFIATEKARIIPCGDLKTFGDVLRRYEFSELPKHRSGLNEAALLKPLQRHWVAKVPCSELTAVHLAAYRDERLRQVKPGSVQRVFNLIRPMIDIANREWEAEFRGNPAREVHIRVPDDSRQGRLSQERWEEFVRALHRRRNKEVGRMVELALETAMRRSELLNLNWEHINLDGATAYIPITKNGHPRTIALSPRAVGILMTCPWRTGQVFRTSVDSVRSMFQRVRKELGISDLCFHMTRHEAISRMWELGLNDVEISSQSGHRDLRMLRRYSHIHIDNLVSKLQRIQGLRQGSRREKANLTHAKAKS